MTEEGELKKRSVTVHHIWKTFSHCLPAKVAEDRLVPEDVIDEAKKEFPVNPATQFKFDWSKIHSKKQAKQISEIIDKAQVPYKEWFKKWFGDSS